MALPPPPKYRHIIEGHDSKHVLKERAKREAAKALAVARFKKRLEEERRRNEGTVTITITPAECGTTYSTGM